MNAFNWLQTHKFLAHFLAFLMMVVPPIPLYLAAESGAGGWIWFLLAPVIAGNLLELAIK